MIICHRERHYKDAYQYAGWFYLLSENHGKVIEKTVAGERKPFRGRPVLGIVPFGGAEVSRGRTQTIFEIHFQIAPS